MLLYLLVSFSMISLKNLTEILWSFMNYTWQNANWFGSGIKDSSDLKIFFLFFPSCVSVFVFPLYTILKLSMNVNEIIWSGEQHHPEDLFKFGGVSQSQFLIDWYLFMIKRYYCVVSLCTFVYSLLTSNRVFS